jgi:protease IV
MRRLLSVPMPLSLALFFLCCAGGCGAPSFLITPVANANTLEESEVQPGKGMFPDKIAIIEVEGMLANIKTGGLLQATENPVSKFTQQLDEAERDPKVKAVVLRVNSPGGTVTSSDTLYQLITRFREKTHKPVVTSAQEVMASGGYYVACASDKIVVQPTSIVGSVGVIFETMQFKGTMDKLGITARSIKSGSLKDMGSPFRLMRPDEEQVMQQMVDEYFTKFVGVVRSRRPVTEAPSTDLSMYSKDGYAGIYSGRVWSGQKAVELGLADRTGLLSDAIDLAREMGHAPNAKVVMYTRPYGYGGSIYANSSTPTPQANVLRLELPEATNLLPTGFYYLWRP